MDPSSHGSRPPSGSLPLPTVDERVDEAGRSSFPARDRPAWTSAHGRHPHAHQDDPDGGDNRERARRRRHID